MFLKFLKRAEVKPGGRARRALRAALVCALALAPALARAQQREADPAAGVGRRPSVVNLKPFEDLALYGKSLVEEGRLGPHTRLDVSATAEFARDGSFDPETVRIEWREAGDESVAQLARQFVMAVSQSGLLRVLSERIKAVRLSARLDRQNVSLGVEGETGSEAEAANLAGGYDAMISLARLRMKGTREGELYDALKVASDGRLFKVSFEMPKADAAMIVADLLAKRSAAAPAARNQE